MDSHNKKSLQKMMSLIAGGMDQNWGFGVERQDALDQVDAFPDA